jgi:DHA2 family multidrug resistance protein
MARGQIYAQLNRQASTLGYGDVYRLLFWMSVGMMFFALLLSKNKPGEGAPAGEGAA